MKFLLSLILFVAFTFNLSAQHDPKAKEILDHLSESTQAHKTIKAKFTSIAVNKDSNIEEEYKGTLWQKGEKYKLNFMDATTFFNGKLKWVFMPDVQEVNLFSVDNEFQSESIFDNPQEIFTIYEEGYKYRYNGKKTFNGKESIEIELVPEDTGLDYFKIKLYLNNSKDEIRGFKYFLKDGTRVTATIDEFKTGINMPDKMFTFSKEEHPDAEVIDMRE